ncbi:phosphonate C-P lyase system protein PhnG [Dankookia rubra]|uniref:Phosphonate C-P lyase system protein PhnG n=1 Tax=Dankookia rubra TaxID=1442381 RepID=A0A4V6PKE8_9PROT|nr:phosphonate C-P lyase system protein PhnG [Dankookia rubra]TDH63985.1 phosphonate C-P lyase system protein PhnG [Dankookia rubra]
MSLAADAPNPAPTASAARRCWMGILARASRAEIASLLQAAPPLPAHRRLRGPETGLVMARGRQGGDGAPFNLGELTVTRCSITLDDGTVGHAYVAGRDAGQAEIAAVLDAALQDPGRQASLLAAVIEPLAAAQAARAARDAARAAATRVQFFTMATMR